ncbi:hypothetical protein EIP91_003206 [Steccherinum ochraceum]|uniref:Major facilitator superfamily (MFS) profile domain-containing protein n=1 Tax=Steccherinum ochraceum TaxID=92696 RepID=A0A4R0RVU6_9APHY|nr:hypothetical protein EIP91_003206 [Steccherinum ochraceum]
MAGGPMAAGGGVGANAPKSKLSAILMVSFAAFAGILYGYDTGTISGVTAMQDWLALFGHQVPVSTDHPYGLAISSSRQSLVTSILSAGTFCGSLTGAPVADWVGRQRGVFVAIVIFCFGVAMQTGCHTFALFVVGRVIAGFGVGLVSTLIPMYLSECSPKWIRGAVVTGYQWAITIGILLANVINNATQHRQDHSAWRIPTAVQLIWAFILAVGMLFLPESPRFWIKAGREDKAAKSLARLTNSDVSDPEVQLELEDIKAALKEEQELGETGYLDCFKRTPNKILFRTLTGIGLQAWQQLTGVNFIFYYGTSFFQSAGINNPFLASVATGIVNVFMTIPGMYGVEHYGRRNLLIWGAAWMCFCEFLVGIVGVTISVDNTAGHKALIALICLYIAGFASTWGPIAWVVIGEIFPLAIRAKAMSLSVASNWLWNFALSFATPYLVNPGPGNANLGVKVFFLWGSTCFCCTVFAFFCIPETKGLSLEQVDLLYLNSSVLGSSKYREELLAQDVHIADVAKHTDDRASEEKV